jgi:hypothetical protein
MCVLWLLPRRIVGCPLTFPFVDLARFTFAAIPLGPLNKWVHPNCSVFPEGESYTRLEEKFRDAQQCDN